MVRDGLLLRTYRGPDNEQQAGVSKLPAYLDDYAEMANGLLDLYEATFDLRWLEAADDLLRRMAAEFRDEKNAGFCYTSAVHKNLLVLLRLSKLLDNAGYYRRAAAVLTSMRDMMSARPRAYLNLRCAADLYLACKQPVTDAAALERTLGERNVIP